MAEDQPTLSQELAQAVLTMASDGGMPDSYWATDRRILLACEVLVWTPEHARRWAQEQPRW